MLRLDEEVTSVTEAEAYRYTGDDLRRKLRTPSRPSSNATRTQLHTVTAEKRHTHATALLLAGVPEHVVMRRLGHADVQTTLSTYGWVTQDAEMRSLAQWKNYVAGWKGLHDGPQ